MDIYKKDTTLELELLKERNCVRFSMTPMALQPETGYFQKDKLAQSIPFILDLTNTLTASFYLIEMSQNRDALFIYQHEKKSIQSERSIKTFKGSLHDNRIFLTIEDEEQKQSITLNHAEAFAIATWLKIAATGIIIGSSMPESNFPIRTPLLF
jgi:hypothetical protein